MTTISGKQLKDISQSHFVSFMYKLITSATDSTDLSVGFDRDRNRRRDELTNNKNIKCTFYFRILLKVVSDYGEYQEKATYGMGHKMTLKTKDEAVLDKTVGIADARIKIDHIHWYVSHYTSSIPQQGI